MTNRQRILTKGSRRCLTATGVDVDPLVTYEMGVRAISLLIDGIEGNLDVDAGKVLLEPRLAIRRPITPPIGEASKQPQRRTLGA